MMNRLRLLWRVFRLPGAALDELDGTLDEMWVFYDKPVIKIESPPVVSFRAQYGKTFVRPEFPIMPEDLE